MAGVRFGRGGLSSLSSSGGLPPVIYFTVVAAIFVLCLFLFLLLIYCLYRRLSAGDCPICLQKMKLLDQQRAEPCRHKFHAACIETWLETRDTCPVCRDQIRRRCRHHP